MTTELAERLATLTDELVALREGLPAAGEARDAEELRAEHAAACRAEVRFDFVPPPGVDRERRARRQTRYRPVSA